MRVIPEWVERSGSLNALLAHSPNVGFPGKSMAVSKASGSTQLKQTPKEHVAGGTLPIAPFTAAQQVLPRRGSGDHIFMSTPDQAGERG